jgi:hypothetical protein
MKKVLVFAFVATMVGLSACGSSKSETNVLADSTTVDSTVTQADSVAADSAVTK